MKKIHIFSFFCICLGFIGLLFYPTQEAYALTSDSAPSISVVEGVSGSDNIQIGVSFSRYVSDLFDTASIVGQVTATTETGKVITNASTLIQYTGNEYPLYTKDYSGTTYDCLEINGSGITSALTLGIKNTFRGTISLPYSVEKDEDSSTNNISVKIGELATAPTLVIAQPAGDTNTFDTSGEVDKLTVPIFYNMTDSYAQSFFSISAPDYESIGGIKYDNGITLLSPELNVSYSDTDVPSSGENYGYVECSVYYTPRLTDGTLCSENEQLVASFDLEVSGYFTTPYFIPYGEAPMVVNYIKSLQDSGNTYTFQEEINIVNGLNILLLIQNQDGVDITSVFTDSMFIVGEQASVTKVSLENNDEVFICSWEPLSTGTQTKTISVDFNGDSISEQSLTIRATFTANGVPVLTLKDGDITITPKSNALQTQITTAIKDKIDTVEDEFYTLTADDVVIEIKKAGTEDAWVALETWLTNTYDQTCSGDYSLRYSVTNGSSIQSEYKTKTMTIVDSAPTINVFTFTSSYTYTHEDNTVVSGSFVGSDVDMGDTIKYVWDLNNTNFTASLNQSTGAFSIDVIGSYVGELSFQYWVENTSANPQQSAKRSVSFGVSYVDNSAPVITLNSANIDEAPSNIPSSVSSTIKNATNWKIVNKGQNLNLSELISSVIDDYDESLDISDIVYTLSITGSSATISDGVFTATKEDYSYIRCRILDVSRNVCDVYIAIKVENRIPTLNVSQLSKTVSYTHIDLPITYSDPDEDAVGVETETRVTNGVSTAQIGNVSYSSATGKFVLVIPDDYVGTAQFRFRLYDLGGFYSTVKNYTEYFTMVVTIEDDIAPVITKNTALPNTFTIGRTYPTVVISDYITASDHIDGDITPTIIRTSTGEFNKDVAGTYSYRFTFTDTAGNSAYEDLTLTVVENAAPVIVLSATSEEIFVNGEFSIYNFITKISDAEDGDITQDFAELERLTITGVPENTKNVGKHTIYLSYIDNDDKSSQILTFELNIVKEPNIWWIIWLSVGVAVAAIAAIVIWRIIRYKKISRV